MTTEITESWYNSLIEELKDLLVETEFTSRWTLIEGYHTLGSRILKENDNFERVKIYNQGICNAVAESLQRKPRTIYYAMQFASKYPDLNLLPEGKNISWWHIINKYLTTPKKDKDECIHDPIVICRICKKKLGDEYAISPRR